MGKLLEFAQANRSVDRDKLERHVDRLVRIEASNFMRNLDRARNHPAVSRRLSGYVRNRRRHHSCIPRDLG